MVLPLPGALAQFSSAALKNVSALGGIVKSAGDVQASVSKNIAQAATAATTGPSTLFQDSQEFVQEANEAFLNSISKPPSLSTSLQQSSLNSIAGVPNPSGLQVDAFVGNNVRLGDILPAQQIFQISKNLGNTSMYADPLQAYAHVAGGSTHIKSLCNEAEGIIASITQQISDLLSIQLGINYEQYALMGPEFFVGAQSKIGDVISSYSILCTQLRVRGKFEGAAVSAFCNTITAFQNFVTFANTKVQQFERLRKSIQSGLKRLSQILAEMISVMQSMVKFIPAYVASTAFGPLFRSIQQKVCDQANIDLKKILDDIEAFSAAKADDRSKVNANYAWAGNLEAIKAFVCVLQPSTDVTDPGGEFAPLSSAYDAFSSILTANDPTASFSVLLTQIPGFAAGMAAGATNNNALDLSSAASSILATLAGLTLSLTAVCAGSVSFQTTFSAETALDPERLAGPREVYENIGADNAKEKSLMNAGDTTSLNVGESTTPGQLAESMKAIIDTLPDGNERDQLVLSYENVSAIHRATIMSMDIQKRQDDATSFAVDEEEANRLLVQKANKQFSGLDIGEFDEIFE